jgi:carboxylesterase
VRRFSMSGREIIEGAGPFFYQGSSIGIILIHGGGGGTCADLKPLAEDLHAKGGYTISVPLLPGYGTSPEDLKNTSIQDWYDHLEKEIQALQQTCEKIYMGGHSMGGVLTLITASKHAFNGIFTISAPYDLKGILPKLIPLAKLFRIKYHGVDSNKFKEETGGKWVGYDKIPVNIGNKILLLLKEMKQLLYTIECPALLMQGRFDSEIKKSSMENIFSAIKSQIKKKVWLEQDHPILLCPDHDLIVSEIVAFINDETF